MVTKKCFVIKNILLKFQIPYKTTDFDDYKTDIYWNKLSSKKNRSPF